MATIPESLAAAFQHHQAGRLEAAQQIYRQILAVEPDNSEAIHLLGVLAHQLGQPELAVEYIERAIRLNGAEAAFHNSLGSVFKAQGKFDEAIACYHRSLALNPDFVEALGNLGIALKAQGKLDEAIASFHRALELKPGYAEAHNNLGNVFKAQGRLHEAIACFHRALELKPGYAEAHSNLANTFKAQGRLDEAIACYQRALELRPNYPTAQMNLGSAFLDQGKLDEAIACYRRTLELKPDYPPAQMNLGSAFKNQGKLEEAIACYRRTLELKPDYAAAQMNLGGAFKDQGRMEEAIACYRRALELQPDFAEAHSNLIVGLNYCPGYDAKTIYDEPRRWNRQYAQPLAGFVQPHSNERSANRRLRIGYVSPDLRDHVVGHNLLPLFREHDHQQMEIICYSDVFRRDAFTDYFESHSDSWRNTLGMTDEALARLIRDDKIDILVDAALHTPNNRLLTFARKPAPVQVTFGGYPGTTGLSTMDYRITDSYLDPPGVNDQHYSEESIRLADTYWCYDPMPSGPAVSPLPALAKGYITFGCLNNFCKVNAVVLELWAKVLQAVARSQIVILAPEGSHRQRTLDLLEQQGITPDRVTFVDKRPREQYLELYHRLDIVLDTVPYNGHATSLDSFWMGAPVVTIVGQTVVGRAGLSQLMKLGLPELIADSPQKFVSIAADLAGDLPRLSKLRASLRDGMRRSPLMDAPRFARNVEAAYRDMWQRWCAR